MQAGQTHQDCQNRELKTIEKLFQAKFHVQKLKYLLGNLEYIYTESILEWNKYDTYVPGRSLWKTLPTKADLVLDN